MKALFFYDFPIGPLGIAEKDGALAMVFFEKIPPAAAPSTALFTAGPEEFVKTETPLIKRAAVQLGDYFAGKRTAFDIPLNLQGTPFQLGVWKEMQNIPFGKTCSYGELAARLGKPKAVRTLGTACGRNPIAIIVPCHRVTASGGGLGGYAGGLDIKRYLLELESR